MCSSRHGRPRPDRRRDPRPDPSPTRRKGSSALPGKRRPRPRGPGSLWGWSTALPVAAPARPPPTSRQPSTEFGSAHLALRQSFRAGPRSPSSPPLTHAAPPPPPAVPAQTPTHPAGRPRSPTFFPLRLLTGPCSPAPPSVGLAGPALSPPSDPRRGPDSGSRQASF